jgi:hypothetical protein
MMFLLLFAVACRYGSKNLHPVLLGASRSVELHQADAGVLGAGPSGTPQL